MTTSQAKARRASHRHSGVLAVVLAGQSVVRRLMTTFMYPTAREASLMTPMASEMRLRMKSRKHSHSAAIA